jgi:hypothetical protein
MTREERTAFWAAIVWCGVFWSSMALVLKTVI